MTTKCYPYVAYRHKLEKLRINARIGDIKARQVLDGVFKKWVNGIKEAWKSGRNNGIRGN